VNVGVHGGHQGALVLAHLRPDIGRGGDQHAGKLGAQQIRHAALQGRVAIGVEQHHGHRRKAASANLLGDRGDLGLVGVVEDGAVSEAARAHLEHRLALDQRFFATSGEVVGVGHARPCDLHHVAIAARDHQRDGSAPALDDGVERQRGAMHHQLHRAAGRLVALEQHVDPARDRLGGGGGDARLLVVVDPRGVEVGHDEVGEGAADIDADSISGHRITLVEGLPSFSDCGQKIKR